MLWFFQIGGGPTLNPLNTSWLFDGDWPQHWLGFLAFQREPWTFPVGSVSSLLYPIGTNIGVTDSNPLVSLLVKPFSGVLPAEYQLMGLWLGVCFALQGYFGAALASAVTKDPGQQLIGGYLFVLSPVLVARLGHDTLCAHWLLLGLLALAIREYSPAARVWRPIALAAGAVILAAAVHPYLAVMAWTIAIALLIRFRLSGLLTGMRTLAWTGLITTTLSLVWWVIGYLGAPHDLAYGFGEFSADLLTFLDPGGFSRLLRDVPTMPAQHEGFAFLGLGGVLALIVGAAGLARRRPLWRPGLAAPIAACLLLAIFALSSSVRFAGNEVLNLGPIYDLARPVVDPFRSSGRFVWPLYYLMLAVAIWGVTRIEVAGHKHAGTLLLGLAVAIQATDLKVGPSWAAPKQVRQVALEPYRLAAGQYRHLALAPMNVGSVCDDPQHPELQYAYRFMLLAHRLKLTFNSGHYARVPLDRVRAACADLERAIDAGALDPETIYIAAPDYVDRFKKAGAACGRWDGNWICVSRAGNKRFATFIETGKDPGGN